MNLVLVCVILVSVFASLVSSGNILFLNALASPSHHIFNGEIINSLAARGHNVTVLASDGDRSPPQNVTYFALSDIYLSPAMVGVQKGILTHRENVNPVTDMIIAYHDYLPICEGKNG